MCSLHLLRHYIKHLLSVCAVDGFVISSIGRGLCVLIGVSRNDTAKEMEYM